MFIVFLIIQFGIMYFLNLLGVSAEINAYIFIFFNMIYLVTLIINKYRDVSLYLLIAYFIRIAFMLWDIYARHIFIFPGSGDDSEGFYRTAVLIANNLELLGENIYGGVYTKALGFIFHITGDNRILGQYINVILGMGIVILIYKSLKTLNIREKNIKFAIIIISLLPNALIFSSILLRENFIVFFVVLSVYYFIKWHKDGKIKNQLFSILSIIIASTFHSGVIGIIIGYMFIYILYNRETKKHKISPKSLIMLLLCVLIGIIILSQSDTFLRKFTNIEGTEDIVSTSNSRRGGSQYLSSLQFNNWWTMLLYSPLKMFYFLASPLPWDWRGFNDILTFFIDSIFYLWFIYIIIKEFKYRNELRSNRSLILGLSISLFITVFIFGIGISNTGTAMRHRHKILPLFIILIIIFKEAEHDRKVKKNI